jgi:cardiolipin synthase
MRLTWPNLLSTLRIALIPVFIVLLIKGHAGLALTVFAIAGVTDLLDGAIARFLHQQSVLGAYLDPMADKLLLTAAYILLAFPDMHPGVRIEPWISALVITRDVIIVVVALVIYLTLGISKFQPSRISKWNTAMQIIAVYMVMLSGVWVPVSNLARVVVYVMVLFTVTSGLEYAYRFIYRANHLAEQAEGEGPSKAGEP